MKTERLTMIEEMLVKNPNDPFLRYAAALEFKKSGNTEKAIQLLEELIQQQPQYLASYYQIGKLYEEKGQKNKAIQYYESGKVVAQMQNDKKTLGEIEEALKLL